MRCLDRIRKRSVERSFELAGRAMLSDEPGVEDFVLVHGLVKLIITDQSGRTLHRTEAAAAWIEMPDGRIYDPAAHEYATKKAWHRANRPQEFGRYTRQAASKKMHKTRHNDPWTTITIPVRGGRRPG
jgi:hypothetical protein